MSNPNQDLNQKVNDLSIGDNQKQGQSNPGFNAGASSFVPGQNNQYGNYQGYNQYQNQGAQNNQYNQSYGQYNNQQGYQGYQPQQQYQSYGYQGQQQPQGYGNYQGYQAYNAQGQQPQAPQAQGYQAYNAQAQPAPVPAAAKPKRTLKLAGSSSIKLANATKPVTKEEPKEEKKEEQPEEKKEEKKEEVAEKVPEEKKEDKSESATPAVSAAPSKASTPAPSVKSSTPAPSVAASSSIASEIPVEDEIDEEVVNDLYGGKDHVSIMFMGHVDAGKSTMGGNLLFLTNAVDKRVVEKYEREAKDAGRQGWYLSWIMDTNKEERSDGKTIEVGRAFFETEKRRYTILDAPGHKMYVSEMIGGASQADVGILVISARKGEYETGFEKGGQTREHALLAKTQGINKIIVVVNKMDDPTVNWSEQRYKECTTKLAVYLRGIGYAKEEITFMPVSGYTGAGLRDRIDAKDCKWYEGPSLLEWLDDMKTVNRKINGPFMLPIASKMKDMGLIVEGKIESGHVKKNNSLLMMPNRVKIEVAGIYNETEQEVEQAVSGEQVKLKIKGVEEEDLQPGYVLTSLDRPVKTVTRFAAQIAIVELKSILSNGFSCIMHLHTAIEEVKFVELKHKLEKGTNRKSKKPPAFAKKGMKVIAILEASNPVCAETYADYAQMGRFTLRDQGTTIAIGKITQLM